MQFKIFTIPVADDGSATEEMNRFLRSHKVLDTTQQLESTKDGSYWHFCIKYHADAKPDTQPNVQPEVKSEVKPHNTAKVNYKDILDEKTYATFSILRDIRKKIAEEDGLPVFVVFTNETLAGIAALDEILPETIKTVKGIGDKKNDRFGKRLVEQYNLMKNPE